MHGSRLDRRSSLSFTAYGAIDARWLARDRIRYKLSSAVCDKFVHIPPAPPPSVRRPPIIAIAIKATIKPYSMAVAPRLSLRRRENIRIASTPPSSDPGPHG